MKSDVQTNEAPAAVSAVERPADRLVSLDVFRGLTVAAMILVTNPGTYSARYAPLCHAEWAGATPTDMIFPAFLFAVGVSITLAFSSRLKRGAGRSQLLAHVLRRSAIIFLVGLVVNGFPDYDLHTIRIPGVLQRIALCYLFGAVIYLLIKGSAIDGQQSKFGKESKDLAGIVVLFLSLYWVLLTLVPVPGFGAGRFDSYGNLPAYIDRAVFGVNHLWAYGLTAGIGVTYDPEGILSTLPAICNVLIGILAGEWLKTNRSGAQKAILLAVAGAFLFLLGRLGDPIMPINKRIWTPTFVLLSAGASLVVFAFTYALVDLRRSRWWNLPAMVFGTNAILGFALSNVIISLMLRIRVSGEAGNLLSLRDWIYLRMFAGWLAPINASLAYAIVLVLLNMALIYPLYRKRIFLKA
jgi:predicted acyltransferase